VSSASYAAWAAFIRASASSTTFCCFFSTSACFRSLSACRLAASALCLAAASLAAVSAAAWRWSEAAWRLASASALTRSSAACLANCSFCRLSCFFIRSSATCSSLVTGRFGVAAVAGAVVSVLTTGTELGVSAETAAAAAAGLLFAAGFAGEAFGAGACCSAAPVVWRRNAGGGISIDFFSGMGCRNCSCTRGRFGVTPLEPRGRISGVIITTSSV
jgi:hypothetical protein